MSEQKDPLEALKGAQIKLVRTGLSEETFTLKLKLPPQVMTQPNWEWGKALDWQLHVKNLPRVRK